MSDQALRAAGQVLDYQFYGPPQNQGPGSPYAALDARRSREDIGAVMVLADLELCDRLIAIGITGSTGAALALAPVIEIAWADGKIQEPERLAILGGSDDYGFSQPECRQLLEHWLTVRPSPLMMTAWVDYVRALAGVMSSGDHDELRDSVVNLCRGVAAAAGGIAGFGKVSSAEQKVLDHIHRAFDRE
jgi:hypothetical protein